LALPVKSFASVPIIWNMKGIRVEPRTALMASVEVSWQEPGGIANVSPGHMEDTSPSGACIRLKRNIRTGSEVTVKRRLEEFSGITKYCRRDGSDFVLGLRKISKEAAAQARAQAPASTSPTHAAAPQQPQALALAQAQPHAPASAQAHAAINGATASPSANFNFSVNANANTNANTEAISPVTQVPAAPAALSKIVLSYVTPASPASVPQANLTIVAQPPTDSHTESQATALAQPAVPHAEPHVTVTPPELRPDLPALAPLAQAPIEGQAPGPASAQPSASLAVPHATVAPPDLPLPAQPAPSPTLSRTEPPLFAEGRLHGDALAQPHPSAFTHAPALAEAPKAEPLQAEPHVSILPRANYEVLSPLTPQPHPQPAAAASISAPNNAPAEPHAEVCLPVPVEVPAATFPQAFVEAQVPSTFALASAALIAPAALPAATPVPAPAQRESILAQSIAPAAPVAPATPIPSAASIAPPIAPATTIAPVTIAAPNALAPPTRQEPAVATASVPAGCLQHRAIPIPEMERAPRISQNQQLQQLSPSEVMEMHMQEPTPDKERKAMSSKWMNLTMGRQKQEASNGQTSSKSSSAPVAVKPRPAPADIDVADEIHTDADTMGRGRARPQGDLQSMDDIYRGAGIMTPRMGYSATKIVEMLDSSHMRGLSSDAKRAAVLMALDAASISVSEVERDARRRQDALDAYEADQRKCFEEYWTRKADANSQIQAEIDWLTARSMERIKRNLDDIAAEKAEFARWHTMKQQEAARISEAVALCSKPSAAFTTAATSSSSSVAASSAAAATGEPTGGLMLALAEVEHAVKSA
jgi:hypothetical protein